MQGYKHDCVLCRELNGSKETNFHRIYGAQYSRILSETENFVLIPALGQLTENQLMIIPKKHYLSMKEAIQDFSEIKTLIDYYQNIYLTDEDEIMFFENGNSIYTESSCIEHAHLNLLLIRFDLDKKMKIFFDLDKKLFYQNKLEMLYNKLKYNISYRMVGTYSNGFYAMELNEKPESQFMRKKLAELLQCDKWDWESFGFQSSLLKIINYKQGI